MKKDKLMELRRRYWAGDTTPEEEAILRRLIAEEPDAPDAAHFRALNDFADLRLDEDFTAEFWEKARASENASATVRPLYRGVWRPLMVVAAGLLLLLTFYTGYNKPETVAPAESLAELEVEDPEQAYEMTKQALLLVSAKLNKATKVGMALDKFETAKQKIAEDIQEKEES